MAKAKTQIHEQGQALSVYFDDMLAEPQSKPAPPPEAEKNQPVQTEPDITAAPEQAAEPDTPVESQSEPDALSSELITDTDKHKLLLCEIGGMNLAIAFTAVNNIVHWPAQGLSPATGQENWQLGTLTEESHVEVIDIGQLQQTPAADASNNAAYILLVDERRYGITCDRLNGIITVDDNEISWHQDREQNPWFSGVIAASLHNIIDLPGLLNALARDEMA